MTMMMDQKQAALVAAGSNLHFRHSMSVEAPASRVWAIWMDVPNWPSWDRELQNAQAIGSLGLGVEGTWVPRSGVRSRFRVTAYEEGRRHALETSMPMARLIIERTLRQQGHTTTFTHDVRFAGPAGRLFAALLGPRFRAALPDAMTRIAEQAVRPG